MTNTDLSQRVSALQEMSVEKNRLLQAAERDRKRAVVDRLNADPDGRGLVELMKSLRAAGIDFKPIYILVMDGAATTKPGRYRMRYAYGDGSVLVDVPPGMQRIL